MRVSLGAITVLVLAVLLTLLLFATVDRFLHAIVIGNGAWVSVTDERLYAASAGIFHLSAVSAAAFTGGVVAGGPPLGYPGVRGAFSAALVVFGVFTILAATSVSWLWEPASTRNEVYTRAELVDSLIVVGVVLFVVSPLALLAGYLGGRYGQPILRLTADR